MRQANSSLFSDLSSRGNRRLELGRIRLCAWLYSEKAHHSEQKRKRMGSLPPFAPGISAAGDDMVSYAPSIVEAGVVVEVGARILDSPEDNTVVSR